MDDTVLLETRSLKKYFPVRMNKDRKVRLLKAVDNVDLKVRKGATIGIVGESGCGKSTLARLILRLLEPTDGDVIFEGKNITDLSQNELQKTRRHIQMIFQDPYASLNPHMRVGETVREPFLVHSLLSASEAKKKAMELLELVGLSGEDYRKFPHEFSGGQRQRICIARAVALHPKMIICDECVSALDVSVQAQIINMLIRLQKEFGLTLVFISHDLRIVRHISTDVAVMYLGKVVEMAPTKELFTHPSHPYTRALLSAVPIARPGMSKQRISLPGELPSPLDLPLGCCFSTRCLSADESCKTVPPKFRRINEEHYCRCLKAENLQKGDSI